MTLDLVENVFGTRCRISRRDGTALADSFNRSNAADRAVSIRASIKTSLQLERLVQTSKINEKILARLITLITILRQDLIDDFLQSFGNVMPEAREWRSTLSRKNAGKNFVRCVSCKGSAAGNHLVQYDSQAPDVAPLVDSVTARLLWRHIRYRTHYNSWSGLETGRRLTVDGC